MKNTAETTYKWTAYVYYTELDERGMEYALSEELDVWGSDSATAYANAECIAKAAYNPGWTEIEVVQGPLYRRNGARWEEA